MSHKKYLRKSINFGKKGELSREIIEELIKKSGKNSLSKIIRELIVVNFSKDKSFNQSKINLLLNKRKELKSQLPFISKELLINEKKLNKLGYKLKGLE